MYYEDFNTKKRRTWLQEQKVHKLDLVVIGICMFGIGVVVGLMTAIAWIL